MEKIMKKIGIIGAMDVEIEILHNIMKENGSLLEIKSGGLIFYEGNIKDKNVILVKSGIGKVNAALCAQQLILEFKAEAVINTGIAGAVSDELDIFDFVISTDAVYHDMDATVFGYKFCEIPQMKISAFKADEKLIETTEKAFNLCPMVQGHKIIRGRIATGDQFVSEQNSKEHIKKICNPACIEMEGCAVAHACYLNKTPYIVLRCMSDKADESYKSSYSFNEPQAAKKSAAVIGEILGLI